MSAEVLNRFGGRRFTLTSLSSLAFIILLVSGYIDEHVFLELELGIVALYIAGNGAQRFTESKYAVGNSDQSRSVDTP